PAPHLSDPALGVLVVDDLFRGCGLFGAIPGIVLAIVIAVIGVPLGWMASAFSRARPRRPREGLSRHRAISGRKAEPGARTFPLGRPAFLRQCRVLARPRARCSREVTYSSALACRRR